MSAPVVAPTIIPTTEELNCIYNLFIDGSPIILATIFTSLSFIFQNATGVIYLTFLFFLSLTRSAIYYTIRDKKLDVSVEDKCSSKFGMKQGFSAFVFGYTLIYVFIPMFYYNDMNASLMWIMIVYLITDFIARYFDPCIQDKIGTFLGTYALNFMAGLGLGAIIVGVFMSTGLSRFLFFNDISASKEVCSMKSQQSFKCAVK